MRGKSIRASVFYFIGNIFDKAIAFITVPIFTRLLSTADYGITSTYLSWVSVLSVVITLSLGESARNGVVEYSNDKDSFMSSIISLGTISALVITGILYIGSYLFDFGFTPTVVLLCCAHSYAVSIITAVQWQYVMEVKYVSRTLLQSIPNLLIVIISIILIRHFPNEKYLGRIIPNVFILFIITLAYLLFYFYRGKCFVSMKYWKYALNFSLPVIFHTISSVILAQADRTMILSLRSSSEAGIYGLAYQFGSLPQVIVTTCENIWVPWLTKMMHEKKYQLINQMVEHYILLVAVLCAEIMLISPEILKIMTVEDYYDAIFLISPIIAATFFLFLATISVDVEYFEKNTRSVAANSAIVALINIVLNFLFIPKYGAIAATFTTLSSYFMLFLLHYFTVKSIRKELLKPNMYFVPVMIVMIVMVITELLAAQWWVRWGMGVALLIVLGVYGYKQYTKYHANCQKTGI